MKTRTGGRAVDRSIVEAEEEEEYVGVPRGVKRIFM